MNNDQSSKDYKYFTNSTGSPIRQLYLTIEYRVPGKVYPSMSFGRKQSHSLITYAHRLFAFLLSIELRQLFSTISLRKGKTLHSVFRKQSLAILSNSTNLHAALCKAQEYNIPLLQIVIQTPLGEQIVKERLLTNFTISHFINQNFVLYGDWQVRQELFDSLEGLQFSNEKFNKQQGLYLRKGQLVYAFIPFSEVEQSHEHLLQQNLTRVRNLFYILDAQKQSRPTQPEPNFSPQPSSQLEPQLSGFGILGTQNYQPAADPLLDNFNDSDNQMEIEP